jgi:signal transduction histidine kinase
MKFLIGTTLLFGVSSGAGASSSNAIAWITAIAAILTAIMGVVVHRTNQKERSREAKEQVRVGDAAIMREEHQGWNDIIKALRDRCNELQIELAQTKVELHQALNLIEQLRLRVEKDD